MAKLWLGFSLQDTDHALPNIVFLLILIPHKTMTLEIGSIAPNFTLKTKTAEGLKDISLADYHGSAGVVLLFSPLHLQVYAWLRLAPFEMISVNMKS